ncbi:hypothetical protein, conserved [Leishmania tarentolae]|uniref:Uncharacterized protein n=1 Tax=Leishmania tarentolae TaxID=5689 RepID=A0A640KHU1_LEITA|nr:hypothetical protein, conserved [Leishmania tarentolae]
MPIASRTEASSGADVAPPLRLETASGADVPIASRTEASSGADVAPPLRLETASGADVPIASRTEASSGADVAPPLRLETASGADVPIASRTEASSGADVAPPLRLETASGADVPIASRTEASSGADVAPPLRLETASDTDALAQGRRDAEDSPASGNLGVSAVVSADASKPSKGLATNDGRESCFGFVQHGSVDGESAAVSQDAHIDVQATLSSFPSSPQQPEQVSGESVSMELATSTGISSGGSPCGLILTGRGYGNNEEGVNGGQCLATHLWSRRQRGQAVQRLRDLQRRERHHRQSVVKREVEGRYAIRLCEASDAADVGPEWLRDADKDTFTATSFTLSSCPSGFVEQLPQRVEGGRRREATESRGSDRLADEGTAADRGRYEMPSNRSGHTPPSSTSSVSVTGDAEQPRAFKRACTVDFESQAPLSYPAVAEGAAAEDTAVAETHDSPAVREVDKVSGTPAPEGTISRVGVDRTQQRESDYAATIDSVAKSTVAASEDALSPFSDKSPPSHLKSAFNCSGEAAVDTLVDEMMHEVVVTPQRDGGVCNTHMADAAMPHPPPQPLSRLEGQCPPPSDLWTLDKGESEGDGGEENTEAMMTSEGQKRSGGNNEYEGRKHVSDDSSSAGHSIASGTNVFPADATATAAGNVVQPTSPSRGDERISSSITSTSSSSSEFTVKGIAAQAQLSPSESADENSTGMQRTADDGENADASAATAFKWARASSAAATEMGHAQARADAATQANVEGRGGGDDGAGHSRNTADDEDNHVGRHAYSAGAAMSLGAPVFREKRATVDERTSKDDDEPRPSYVTPQPTAPSPPPYATAPENTDVPMPTSGAATAMTTGPTATTTTMPLCIDHDTQPSTALRCPAPAFATANNHPDEEQPRPRQNARTSSSSGASSESFFYSLPGHGAAHSVSRNENSEEPLQHQPSTTGEIASPVSRRPKAVLAPHALHQRPWEQRHSDRDTEHMTTDAAFLREAWHSGLSSDIGGGIHPDDAAHHPTVVTAAPQQRAISWTIPLDWAESVDATDCQRPLGGHTTPDASIVSSSAAAHSDACAPAEKLDRHQKSHGGALRRRLPPHLRSGRPWAHLLTRGLRTAFFSTSSSSSSTDGRGEAGAQATKNTMGPGEAACAHAEAQVTFTAAPSAVPRRSGPWYATPARDTKAHHATPVALAKAALGKSHRSLHSGPAARNAEKASKVEEWARTVAGTPSVEVLRDPALSCATAARSTGPTTAMYATPGTRWPAGLAVSPPSVRTRTLPPPPRSAAFVAPMTSLLTRTASAPAYSGAEAARNTSERLLQLRRQRQLEGLTYVQLYEKGRSFRLKASAKVWRPSPAARIMTESGRRACHVIPTSTRGGVCGRGAASQRSAVVWRLTGAPRPRSTEEARAVRQQEQLQLPQTSMSHEGVAARSLLAADVRDGRKPTASSRTLTDAAPQAEYAVDSRCSRTVPRAPSTSSLSPPPPPSTAATVPCSAAPTALSMKDVAEEGVGDGDKICNPLNAYDREASGAHTSEVGHGMAQLVRGGLSATAVAATGEKGATHDRDKTAQGKENNAEGLLETKSGADSYGALHVSASTSPPLQPPLPSPSELWPPQAVVSEEGDAHGVGRVEPHTGSGDATQLPSRRSSTESLRGSPAGTGGTERGHGLAVAAVDTVEISSAAPNRLSMLAPETTVNPHSSIDAALQGQDVGTHASPTRTPMDDEGLSPDTDAVLFSIVPAPPVVSEAHTGHGASSVSPATAVPTPLTNSVPSGIPKTTDTGGQSGALSTHQLAHPHVTDEAPAPVLQPSQLTSQPSPSTAESPTGRVSATDGSNRVIPPPPEQQQQRRREVLKQRIAQLEVTLMLQQQQRHQTDPSFFRVHDSNAAAPVDFCEAAMNGSEDLPHSTGGGDVELQGPNMRSSLPRGWGRNIDGPGGPGAVSVSERGQGVSRQAQRDELPAVQTPDHHLPASESAIHWSDPSGLSIGGTAAPSAASLAPSAGCIATSGDIEGLRASRRRGLHGAAAPTASHSGHVNRSGLVVSSLSPEAISAGTTLDSGIASYTRLAHRRYGSAATSAVVTPADPRYSHATTSFLISADWRYQRIYVDSRYSPETAAHRVSRGADAVSGAPQDLVHRESERAAPAAVKQCAFSATHRDADVFVCRPFH